MIEVVLADDQALVRAGFRALLDAQHDIRVVGEAADGDEAVRLAVEHRPDVVLMDIRMPGEGGIEAARQITERFPGTRVVMLTSFADDELVVRAIRAGAVGYVLKQVGNEELLRAIAAAARGEALLDPATTARLLSRVRESERKAEADAFRALSAREVEVLGEVARGRTNAEVGQRLNLSEKTVRNYVSTILEKLHLTNRIELATYAVEHHIYERLSKE